MILDDEELFARLESKHNIAVLPMKASGNKSGWVALGTETKELIARLSLSGESGVSIAESFDVAPSTVSKISRGLECDNETVDVDLVERLNSITAKPTVSSKVSTAHERALDVLVSTLDTLQPKLSEVTKPRDLSKIASDMSRVALSLSGGPSGSMNIGGFGNKVQVIVHAPALRSEKDFEFVEA